MLDRRQLKWRKEHTTLTSPNQNRLRPPTSSS